MINFDEAVQNLGIDQRILDRLADKWGDDLLNNLYNLTQVECDDRGVLKAIWKNGNNQRASDA